MEKRYGRGNYARINSIATASGEWEKTVTWEIVGVEKNMQHKNRGKLHSLFQGIDGYMGTNEDCGSVELKSG